MKRSSFLILLVTAVMALSGARLARALDKGADGYFHTGDGIRVKTIAFVNFKVYAIGHDMKELPPAKSKQAVIDMDTGKRFTWRMMRDVDAGKIQNALKEAYAMNGFADAGRIGQFVGAFNADLKEGQFVTITYDPAAKATTLRVLGGGGSSTVPGVDFMKATWSVWFGKMDQPSLGDALISKM